MELIEILASIIAVLLSAAALRFYPAASRKAGLNKIEHATAKQAIYRRCVTAAVLWVESEIRGSGISGADKLAEAVKRAIIECAYAGVPITAARAKEIIPSVLAERGLGPSAKPKPATTG